MTLRRRSPSTPNVCTEINEVMAAQADVATIDHTLHQFFNYTGI